LQEPKSARERLQRAEAHTGLGYVYACQKRSADAQREVGTALAVLQGERHYIIQHNLACICAVLSQHEQDRQKEEDEDLAIMFLRQEWESAERTGATEQARALIRQDKEVFPPALRQRPEFKKLVPWL